MSSSLSVLDLVPVSTGGTTAAALADSLELVRRAEAAGYERFWFAEHHLNPGVIGSSPAVLIALAAGVSTRIRLGSGAVQLGHRTALSVAEEFGLLELAAPGRIDLGLGRSGRDPRRAAPTHTGDRRTPEGLLLPAPFVGLPGLLEAPRFRAQGALLGSSGAAPGDYDDQVGTLQDLFAGRHQVEDLTVGVPTGEIGPQLWVLGSSGGTSAEVAGARGLPFAANYHVAPSAVLEAVAAYRAAFRPTDRRDRPHVMVSADVVVADDADTAVHLAQGYEHWVHSIRSGAGAIRYPEPAAAAATPLSAQALSLVADRTATRFVGNPWQVAAQLRVLQQATAADELLITTITHDPAARVRSHDLLAQAWSER